MVHLGLAVLGVVNPTQSKTISYTEHKKKNTLKSKVINI